MPDDVEVDGKHGLPDQVLEDMSPRVRDLLTNGPAPVVQESRDLPGMLSNAFEVPE